jgi:dTDP-4-amino-4,6-dideoxygalactose transaminase
MILTDHWELAETCQNLRDNGKQSDHTQSGTNSKMSEADCAQMLVKLKYFNDWQARRRQIADYYTEELDGIVYVPEVADEVEHAWHKYVIHHERRNNIKSGLEAEGIETRIHYMPGLHLETVSFSFNTADTRQLEGAEEFSRTCLSLPIYPELLDIEVEQVVETIRQSIY